jgi:hypothetical protein
MVQATPLTLEVLMDTLLATAKARRHVKLLA